MPRTKTSAGDRPVRPGEEATARRVDPRRLAAAALGFLRFSVVVASLVVLVLARTTSPYVLAGAVAVVTLVLALTGGRRAWPWLAYIVLITLFVELRGLADETAVPVRFDYVVALDGLAPAVGVPTVWLQQTFHTPGAMGLLDVWAVAVYSSYFVVPHLLALVLWRFRADDFRRFAVAVLSALYAGLVLCFLVPTAPPWLAGQTGHLPAVSRIVQDAWSPDLYRQGYELVGINPVAAMPSLHTAVTVLVAAALWRYGRVLRVAGVLYALSMAFALVYTGEHYVVDVLAGLVVAGAAAWFGERVRGTLSVRPVRRADTSPRSLVAPAPERSPAGV